LKQADICLFRQGYIVAPCAGAWIETSVRW